MLTQNLDKSKKTGVIDTFTHKVGDHCMTSAMRDIFNHYKHDFSEDLLFGLGRGLGLGYMKFKGMDTPIIGGRNYKLEDIACKALDIKLTKFKTKNAEKGWKFLKSRLEQNRPSMIVLDMFYLEYSPEVFMKFHFGMHGVVVGGFDPEKEQVWIADTGLQELQPLSVELLKKARSSTGDSWLKPKNKVYQFTFPSEFPDLKEKIPKILRRTGKDLFKVSKLLSMMGIFSGISSIDKLTEDMDSWAGLSSEDLANQCFQIAGFISDYGTGGGIFRYMYSRFLRECSDILQDKSLLDISGRYQKLGDDWEQISSMLKEIFANSSNSILIAEKIKMIKTNLQLIKGNEFKAAELLVNYRRRI